MELKSITFPGMDEAYLTAPGGYGLGEAASRYVTWDTVDSCVKCGNYRSSGSITIAGQTFAAVYFRVDAYNIESLTQTLFGVSGTKVCVFRRSRYTGGWSEWVDCSPTAFAPSGTGYEKLPVVLKTGSVTDEADLTSVVEALYSTMGSNETRLVRFYGYPSASSYNFFGFLFKSSANYGSLLVHSAFEKGTLWKKVKFGGTWQDIKPQATSMDLLWKNASFSTSGFSNQKISLDLSGYDAILITASTQDTAITPIGDMGTLRSWSGNYICTRAFSSDANGVNFNDTIVYTTYGTNATNKTESPSWQCVPYKIYGIKGVG